MKFAIAKLYLSRQNETQNGGRGIKMLFKRKFSPPDHESFFLFGPRGTGKTTYLHQLFDEHALWIDLLDPQEERRFSKNPELLKDIVIASKEKIFIIDEVQKVPQILDAVHLLIEEKKERQFILTGSSARKIRRSGVNLLAGRALWKNFYPFVASELEGRFQLEKALTTGMIPLIWDSEKPEEKLNSYIDLYLQEEVKAEALVRQIGPFSRFLEVMAYSHGSILNFSNISRECEVARKTVEGYFQILLELLLGFTLPIFEKRAKRDLSSHKKFYFFDPGVFRALRREGFLDRSSELEGIALEGLVAEHLRFWGDSHIKKSDLYFWRTRSGLEVDLVLYGPDVFYALEIKNNKTINSSDLRGLHEFSKDYPEATSVFLYRGSERLKKGNIYCIPVEEFLIKLDPAKNFQEALL